MRFIRFLFCLLRSKLQSVGHSKKGALRSNSLLQKFGNNKLYCWHSRQKLQYEDVKMFRCKFEDRFIFTLLKSKHPVHIIGFRVRLSLYSYSHMASDSSWRVILSAWRSAALYREDVRTYVWWQESASWQTSRGTQCWLWENFYNPITPNIKQTNSSNCHPFYYIWDTVERKTIKTPFCTKNELKARITVAFTNFNEDTV